LTIKSISNTNFVRCVSCAAFPPAAQTQATLGKLAILVVNIARQIFNFQRSDTFPICSMSLKKTPKISFPALEKTRKRSPSVSSLPARMAGRYGGPG